MRHPRPMKGTLIMTCKTCDDPRRGDECGINHDDKACPCCGMVIIGRAEDQKEPEQEESTENS